MIIFLHGADTFRSRRWLKQLQDKFRSEVNQASQSLTTLAGENIKLSDLVEKINTTSLFTEKRLVIVNNIFKNKNPKLLADLTDYLKKNNDSSDITLAFIDEELELKNRPEAKKLFNFLSQQKFVQEFKPLNNFQLLNFIKQEVASYGKEIAPPASAQLLINTNQDLWALSQEIKKLAFFGEEKLINLEMVKALGANVSVENIFALTDAISVKNKALALSLLEEQYLAGLKESHLLAMLIRQFKILTEIKDALDRHWSPAKITQELRHHPYVIKKGIQQAKHFSLTELKRHLNQLIGLDSANKSRDLLLKPELMLLIANL